MEQRQSTEGDVASRWPTLEKQLAAVHAPPGSPLAKLIQENQDFSMLRREEATDNLRLPPWLRVLYRKSHPDGDYSASNPSGGYPQYLWTYLEWATLHPDLPVQQGPESQGGRAPKQRDRG